MLDIENRLGILKQNNFKVISLISSNKFTWNFWTLPNYLRKNPVDIYHTQYITPFFVTKKIRIVTVVHDISFNFFSKFIKFSDLFFLKILIPLSLKRADKIIAVSEFTKREIIKYYKIDPEKVEYIHNAVGDNFSGGAFSESEIDEVKKKYNLPEQFILYVGTLQPRKNIPLLLKAYAKNKDKLSDTKLVIVGNKKAHNFDKRIDDVIKAEKIENDVFFPGYIENEDLPKVYQSADLFMLPSLYEGFGIPILEAMSSGVPVLASDIPSHREVGGEAALYFNPQRLDDLSEKAYNILIGKNMRQNLVDLGSRRISFFSWRRTAEKMLEIYKKLITN
ncbi:glycosyltransferase family 4 protein [Patescibacteria group bacterium]